MCFLERNLHYVYIHLHSQGDFNLFPLYTAKAGTFHHIVLIGFLSYGSKVVDYIAEFYNEEDIILNTIVVFCLTVILIKISITQ